MHVPVSIGSYFTTTGYSLTDPEVSQLKKYLERLEKEREEKFEKESEYNRKTLQSTDQQTNPPSLSTSSVHTERPGPKESHGTFTLAVFLIMLAYTCSDCGCTCNAAMLVENGLIYINNRLICKRCYNYIKS